jgi:hypothetical protein
VEAPEGGSPSQADPVDGALATITATQTLDVLSQETAETNAANEVLPKAQRRRRERSRAAESEAVQSLKRLNARCVALDAAGKLPKRYDAASKLLKELLGDEVKWSSATIRQVIAGRHPLSIDLVANERAEAFWEKFW